ncbi:kinase-like domain-containing protein [Gigaspora rosea]|uniref:Kinase-like domain-containing protein n=1 Tax=Gigaspora rosea TaxID=44941 RepID=A0A397UTQ6_9GLOM|nr:kinase-like domain-containing protein [Gigaspora rosea]
MDFVDGTYKVGHCYQYGIGAEKDERKAGEYYCKAATYEFDIHKAFGYYQKSADMGYADGTYNVGYCYQYRIGVKMDEHKAFEYYQKSANMGNDSGMYQVGYCYENGIFGLKRQVQDKYKSWIRKDENEFHIILSYTSRNPRYGRCRHCRKYNTNKSWCLVCDPNLIIRNWTCWDKEIDYCIKRFQLRTFEYESMIEWIPFERLKNIKKIGQGGFSTIFSAIWMDGIRKIKEIKETDYDSKYIGTRELSSTVALKTLSGSKENPLEFSKEFDNYMKCRLYGSKLKIYGLTRNIKTKEYMMIFQYADNGGLYTFLRNNFQQLTWKIKLILLVEIAYDLYNIHKANYIHMDFHSRNILQDGNINENMHSYISDLGLSKKIDEKNSNGIYGVLPYVAPEILTGKNFTQATDIYAFGVIMTEVSTGQRPFDGYEFGTELALKICTGFRPDFALGTPDCYIELAKQCMDSDPFKRPSAYDIWKNLGDFLNSKKIKKQFLKADSVKPILEPQKHPDHMYTSKLINTREISNALSKGSKSMDVKIPFTSI